MLSKPGIMRDGTDTSKKNYNDGQWSRFYQNLPRKMLGYREQLRNVPAIVRCIDLFVNDGFSYLNMGTDLGISRYALDDSTGVNTGIVDRTPSSFVANPQFNWQMDHLYDVGDGTTLLFAVATPSLYQISSATAEPVYVGDILSTAALTTIPMASFTASIGPASAVMTVTAVGYGTISIGDEIHGAGVTAGTTVSSLGTGTGGTGTYNLSASQTVGSTTLTTGPRTTSGGVCAVAPYLFLYGHDGIVQWSVPGHPHDFTGAGAGSARPWSSKIVKGMSLRGNAAPAAIFWALDALILASFVGGAVFWSFTTLTTAGSILSSSGVIEHNGIYYWATTNGFTMFNGVMRDIDNQYNRQYFLDNLNFANRQKVFAYKVPRWNEIWWCFPSSNAAECDRAVIFNYAGNFWYDTALPNGGRSAGVFDMIYNYPIMAGVSPNADTSNGYSMWQHETGLDEVSGTTAMSKAIPSWIETSEFNLVVPTQPGQNGMNRALAYSYMEPDFQQVGTLELTVVTKASPQSTPIVDPNGPYYLVENPPQNEILQPLKITGRLTRFKITSNEVGGNYVFGSPLIHVVPSDGRLMN